jgi:hypothetical protein
VGIAAIMASFWIQDLNYDQYRPAIPFDTLLVPIHMLLQSLWLHSSLLTNDCLHVKYEHPTAKRCGHCCNGLFVLNTGYTVWSIYTSYTLWHFADTHTFASSVTLTPFIIVYKWWPRCQRLWTCNSKWLLALQQWPLSLFW